MTPAERSLLLYMAVSVRDQLLGIGEDINAEEITRRIQRVIAEQPPRDGVHERSSDIEHG